MKKILLIISFLLFSYINAQEYTYEDKTMTGVFEAKGKNKSELFSLINKWISINYNSSKDVVQLNDKESGTIIIKGVNETKYKNAYHEIKNSAIEYGKIKLNHLLEINVKDERYRVIFKITDIQDYGNYSDVYNNLTFPLLTFSDIKQTDVDDYNLSIDVLYKNALIGKKKREKIQNITRPIFEEFSENIKIEVKAIMLSLQNSVIESKKDDW